jgi:hypothetical protein
MVQAEMMGGVFNATLSSVMGVGFPENARPAAFNTVFSTRVRLWFPLGGQ